MTAPVRIRGAVVGTMATFPDRFTTVLRSIQSAARQVDRLFVYVNQTTEGFPDISGLPNVTVLDGREHAGDLSANGKIYPIRYADDCTVFLLDDDIIYPPDYIATYRRQFDRFESRCVLTAHGSIFPPHVDWYYERTRVFTFREAVAHLQLCALAGSGTFAFEQRTLRLQPDEFLGEVMVDLRVSLLARAQRLPIWVVPRRARWLGHIESPGLWEKMRTLAVTCHTRESRGIDWSFGVYRDIALSALEGLPGGLRGLGLDPELERGLRTGTVPSVWRTGTTMMRKRKDYLEVLSHADRS